MNEEHYLLKIGHYVERPGRRPEDSPITIPIAEELETVPGVPINQEDVEFYSREYPLMNIKITERAGQNWAVRIRDSNLENREIRIENERLNKPLIQASRLTRDMEPTAKPTGEDVANKIKAKASELGFGEVGITKYDHHYTYQSKKGWAKYPHAICLAYEQAYEATQTIPSVVAEMAHISTYRIKGTLGLELGDYIRSLGYHAQVHNPIDSTGPYIPMFVQAGLGQLGANGQLLSPHFGSRARVMIITTDANLTYDQPIDYGIHRFSQICQVCVNRCPGRALMREKVWWRGVQKNKLVYKRCQPVMARYMGCAVCMKVCPIQKYGMKAVMEHYVNTGQVWGKGTHELEGYQLDGMGYFDPGELPTFDTNFFHMPRGTTEEHVLEQFNGKFNEVGSANSREGEALFEELKTKLVAALDLSPDVVTSSLAEEEATLDYV